MKYQRIAKLIKHDINLLAYHLPLDAHPVVGNNAQIGRILGAQKIKVQGEQGAQDLLFTGILPKPMKPLAFNEYLACLFDTHPIMIAPNQESDIQRIAWCSGGAQGFFEQATDLGVDAYVSGEISEPNAHIAHETGVAYYAMGHHASERYGVKALGEHLAEKFNITCEFVDIKNPA